jgi:uncharacterized membrane protein YjgN (DUF898 family)
MTDTSPTAAADPTTEPARELTLAFRGRTADYFRLWAVNLCLTLVTLGLYSAWAKVRKKRYFYSHTTLDGTPFQYLGQPLPILKGRLIAVLVFVLYYLSDNFFTALLPYVLVLGVLLAPWVIVRSAAFNARYSAFRNMTFRFAGDYRGALKALYWLGIIPLLVAGTIFDWWGNLYLGAGAYLIAGLLFPWWIRGLKNFIVSGTQFGGVPGAFAARGRQFFRIYAVSGLILLLAGIATAALFGTLLGTLGKSSQAILWASAPIYAGYVLAFAYVQAHSSNLVWNHTRLGPLRFASTLTGWGLMKLYISNALGIVVSLGLLTPWAVMRTVQYRIDHMRVMQDGELTAFQGSGAETVQAAGAEVGELFDVDLSL